MAFYTMDEYIKKNKKKSVPHAVMKDIGPVKKRATNGDIAPIKTTGTNAHTITIGKKGYVLQPILPLNSKLFKDTSSAVAKDILDVDNMSLEEVRENMNSLKWYETEKQKTYRQAEFQKVDEFNVQYLSSHTMDGTDHSVYDEMQLVAEMEDGEE